MTPPFCEDFSPLVEKGYATWSRTADWVWDPLFGYAPVCTHEARIPLHIRGLGPGRSAACALAVAFQLGCSGSLTQDQGGYGAGMDDTVEGRRFANLCCGHAACQREALQACQDEALRAYRLGYEDRAKERDFDPGHALDRLTRD